MALHRIKESSPMEKAWDERRRLVIPGDQEKTIAYCTEQWVQLAKEAIQHHGYFAVALSGGSTPKAIFERLCKTPNKEMVDWKKVYVFWSDERAVEPSSSDSNYKMAMDAGFSKLPLLKDHIFRMEAESRIVENALAYERLIKERLKDRTFDLIMVGMGDDGHTASLFPHTEALDAPQERLVVANHLPQKQTWRMTFTYTQLHKARHLCVYVLGKNKAETLVKVFKGPFLPRVYPSQKLGTKECVATWIMDDEAARPLIQV